MYGQIRKEIAVNNTNTNKNNNTNTTMNMNLNMDMNMNMMIDVNDCDPEVEEVTGSLVQRLKLDQQQKEQLQQQQQHQSLQRIQSRLSTAINANAAIIATLVSQNGTITGTGTSTNECEAVAVTMATATESFETALHQIQHQHQHQTHTQTQTQHLTLTSGNLHAKSYRDTNSHSNLSTHGTNANANANANDIIHKNQGFNDYIKDQLNGTHNHNRNHPSPTYQDQDQNEHEHAQQGQSQHQGQDGTCTMKQKEHIHDKTSANANLNSNPRTVSELTVSELFASELTASELTASELTASELTASELTVSESNRNHNVLKESPYNSDSGYAGSASSNDTGSGSSSDSDRKQDYDEHEHEHGHDLGHHGHGHGHGRKTNGTRAEARAINRHGKRDASSSDLADFSSSSMSALGASGSGSASGSACASASDTRRRSGSASGSGSACSYSSSSLASPLMNAIAMQIGVASLPLSEESGSGLLDLDPTGTRNLYQSTAVKPSGNRHGHGHGHGHGSVQSKGVRFGTEREQKREREREWEQERTSANNSNSSFPSRHRRRHNTKTHRDREKEHKHTTRTTVNANANSNADNDHLMNKVNDVPPTYKLPGSWSFVERQLKRKMDHEDCIIKKLYEDQRKELDSNFKNAMKRTKTLDNSLISNSSPIYDVGVDVMANILSYLKPVQAYSILSLPISKTFQSTFSNPQDLWRVLCLSAPFYAKQDKAFYAKQDKAKDKDSSDDSSSYPVCNDIKVNHLLGRYRLLYSSLIKCVRYLDRIQEDSRNGRTPAGVYDSDDGSIVSLGSNNMSLKNFFATVHATRRNENADDDDGNGNGNGSSSISSNSGEWGIGQKKECSNANAYANGVGNENKTGTTTKSAKKLETKAKVKYGVSKLTNRLLGPSHLTGVAGNISLPWSCAIYSVVNWMVAFADVAGIQQMCLKVLPDLLVDEQQRTSAQHAGLTEIVLRAMVLFPDMVDLHTSAFHTLVLLARPLGGKEGMLFHTSMVNASGLFNVGSSTGKSGIAIMLDSMKRFVGDEDLQAMSCWSMVNIALIPSQKVVLVRLGGISAAGNAMIHHPHNAEVQFRALFALINLVIPSENISDNPVEAQTIMDQIAGMNQDSEVEMLNDSMEQVTNLVVVAMKNFCSSEAILNRACLVLHNLSLNEGYHRVLLLTPNCYQMLQWCIGNYRHDAVLQQSARGTLQRLQLTLSSDPSLREQFTAGLGIQQQHQQLAAPANNSDAALVPPQEQPLEPNVIHELGR